MDFVTARNVPEAFLETLWQIRVSGKKEETRNGAVLAMPGPFFLTIYRPWERLLFDPIRQANPYFHMAEFIWMMAGSRDIKWIARYNKRMLEYSDDGINQSGAYGYRWREHWGHDQIEQVIKLIRQDPFTRRAVLAMWDPDVEKGGGKDLPCNTHIYFRANNGLLDMTVCNRSNDAIWGMLGANAVHMTMLHELISQEAGLKQGNYNVFTNNLHIYKSLPNYDQLIRQIVGYDSYRSNFLHFPLLNFSETYQEFIADAEDAVFGVSGFGSEFRTRWFRGVAQPMMQAYDCRRAGQNEDHWIANIKAEDWQLAATKWKEWKDG